MEILRPAGFNERRCIARDALGVYGSIITIGTYTTPPGTSDNIRSAIIHAVKSCIAQHPVLSIAIHDCETEHPQLTRVPQVNLESHIFWDNLPSTSPDPVLSLKSWLEQIHNTAWSTASPPVPKWRLHLASSPSSPRVHAAFATSHAIADGRSGLLFHEAFLLALRTLHLPPSLSLPLSVPPSTHSIPPPLDLAGPFPISWSFLLPKLAAHLLPSPLTRLLGLEKDFSHIWRGADPRPEVKLPGPLIPTRVHVTKISTETLEKVLGIARERKARLTGLMEVVTVKGVDRALRRRGRGVKEFIVDAAVDLRRNLPATMGKMGNCASVVDDRIVVPECGHGDAGIGEEDWETARQVTEHLAKAAGSLQDQPVALLKYVGNYQEFTAQQVGSPAGGSFSMSNLGVFRSGESSKDGNWKIEEMLFSQSADGTGTPFNISLASSEGGPLTMVMSWWPGMLGLEDERDFAVEVCTEIARLLEGLS